MTAFPEADRMAHALSRDVSAPTLIELPESVLELIPAAVYVCDRDGVVVRCNRRATELWGRHPNLGDIADRFCGSYQLYRLDGGPLPRAEYPMANVLRTGEPVRDQEVIIERADGSRIVALANIDALRNEAGTIIGAVNCFHDITGVRHVEEKERKAREALRKEERQSRKLLDALPVAVYTTDAAGRITYFNPAAVEFAGREPTLGSDEWCVTWRLYKADGTPMPHDQCPMAVALKEDRPVLGQEAIAERPDGTRVPFIPYPMPLHDESGALVGAVNMLVDITERKAAEETIRNREERLSAELVATKRLQVISAELIQEQNVDALYQKLVDAAAALMDSDYASMQMLHPERGTGGELRLLASRGFTAEATRFWEWVRADSGCTCGEAMRRAKRAIATNVETCDFMAGTPDRTAYLEAGILAAQSTPLVSRSGRLLGMISTHWRRPHSPTESDLRHLDVLARQAADLIERAEADLALRQASTNLEAELAAMQHLHALSVRLVQQPNDLNSGMREVLSAAAELMKADNCTAQVLDEQGRLILAGALGFDDEFCRQFHTVTNDGFTTCAAALRRRERVVVEDLGRDSSFVEFAKLATCYDVRAAMSTPLLAADGALIGVFTTYWTHPHRPGERDLRLLDLYAQQAARQIERIQNQARVARNQKTLSDLVERAPFGIYIVDSQFRILQMNAGSQTGAFHNVRPVIGRPFDEAMRILWPEAVALQIVSRFRHTLETGEPFYSADFTNPRGDIEAVESYEWELHRLTLPDGQHGVVCYYYDSTRLRQAEQAVRASEERFRSIVTQAEAGVAETDLAGRFVLVNDRYCDITGYSREELMRMCMQDITHPDDLPRNVELFRRLTEDGTPFVIEKRYVRKDGSPVWVSNTVSCMDDAVGRPRNAVAICLDIDDRRRGEEQRSLLLREMGHRVKNLFAVASSLVSMSARGARTVDELATAIRERLGALVRAHELVRPNIVEGARASAPAASTLDALVAALFAPYRSNGRERIVINGPTISVGSRAATGLALVLHELGTNAVKYGALSGEAGVVEITWTTDGQVVHLQWAELGGPALNGAPQEEGFGSRLARMSVSGQLGGEFRREWKSSGLLVHIDLPRDRLAK